MWQNYFLLSLPADCSLCFPVALLLSTHDRLFFQFILISVFIFLQMIFYIVLLILLIFLVFLVAFVEYLLQSIACPFQIFIEFFAKSPPFPFFRFLASAFWIWRSSLRDDSWDQWLPSWDFFSSLPASNTLHYQDLDSSFCLQFISNFSRSIWWNFHNHLIVPCNLPPSFHSLPLPCRPKSHWYCGRESIQVLYQSLDEEYWNDLSSYGY